MDWAIDEEFTDDILAAECLKQPDRQLHVLLEGFSDELDVSWDGCPALCSDCDRKDEADLEFKDLELIARIVAPKDSWLE